MTALSKSGIIKSIAKKVGDILVFMQPKKAQELSENRMRLIHRSRKTMSLGERLMRYSLMQKLEKIEDHQSIAQLNKKFWKDNNAAKLFVEHDNTFKKIFLPYCTGIFEEFQKNMVKNNLHFDKLVEIGTGRGQELNYLSNTLNEIDRFIGLDLSEAQINLNRDLYKDNPKLEFFAADAIEWVKANGQDNTVFVTCNGVLEYFLKEQLQNFLKEINKYNNIIFIAIEPNGADHNFETHPDTQLYGYEPSFSHNYPLLFKEAGFGIWYFTQNPWFEGGNTHTIVGADNLNLHNF